MTAARIVVGVDGSPAARAALQWAARQAALTGATIEAVIAWHLPLTYGGEVMLAGIDWAAEAQATLDTTLTDTLPDPPTTLVRRVVEGHPVSALLHASAGAELLVVGSRGHGGFTGMLLGSVSEHVVAHAPCPVVVVRPAPG